jgi:hypothetical protein
MSERIYKYLCEECGWHGLSTDLLEAPNPFDPKYKCWGCPECKSIDHQCVACDADGCWKQATCGTPMPDKYWHTCGDHVPVKP